MMEQELESTWEPVPQRKVNQTVTVTVICASSTALESQDGGLYPPQATMTSGKIRSGFMQRRLIGRQEAVAFDI